MKKFYSQPELELREYSFAKSSVLTASDPETNTENNLGNEDNFNLNDIFGD